MDSRKNQGDRQTGDIQKKQKQEPPYHKNKAPRACSVGFRVSCPVGRGSIAGAVLTDSTVPLADAFTTALSIVAMWMLARKYLEQWIARIAVDAVCVALYAYKGIPLYAVLYTLYTAIAFIGFRNWRRMMRSSL